MKIKKAMILAAGYGKRMLPITEKIPKPLIKINGISYTVRLYPYSDFRYIPYI